MLRHDIGILEIMERIINQYVVEIEAKKQHTISVVFGLAGVLCISFIVLAYTVFRPLTRKITGYISEIQETQQETETLNEELEQSLEAMRYTHIQLEEKQNQLQKLSAFQRAILDNAPVMIMSTNPQGKITLANPYALKKLGYQAEDELLGKYLNQIMNAQEIAAMFAVFSEKLQRTIPNTMKGFIEAVLDTDEYRQEWTYYDQTDTSFLVASFNALLRTQDNNISGTVIIAEDITERKNHQKQLERLLSFQKAILNNAFNMIISTDVEGVITSFNPAAEKALGYSAEELIGKHTPAVFHDTQEMQATAQALLAELGIEKLDHPIEVFVKKAILGQPEEKEWTYIRKDGSRFPVNLATTVLYDQEGNIIGFMGVAMDISKQKEAEEALQEAYEQYQDLYDNAPIGYHSIGKDTGFISMNKTELNWLGYQYDEVVGKLKMTDIVSEQFYPDFLSSFEIFLTQGFIHIEGEYKRKDGSTFPVMINSTAIYDEVGNYLRSRGTALDITDLKKAQTALQEANHRLEELNYIKDRLFSIISHDLRSPLNSLQGVLTLLEMGGLNETEQSTIVSALSKQVKNTSELLDNLLYWAKSQMQGMELSPVVFYIQTLIRENVDLLTPQAAAKNITLENLSQIPIQVKADREMIKLVIRNIVANAIKFTPQGGKIKIIAEIKDKYCTVSIQDTGAGLPAEQLGKLFKSDTHFTTRGTANEKGTGLGLLLCKDFVERNGGTIGVESEEGKGSRFYFTLPLH